MAGMWQAAILLVAIGAGNIASQAGEPRWPPSGQLAATAPAAAVRAGSGQPEPPAIPVALSAITDLYQFVPFTLGDAGSTTGARPENGREHQDESRSDRGVDRPLDGRPGVWGAVRQNLDGTVRGTGLELDADEWAALRSIDWSLSDEVLSSCASKVTSYEYSL